MLKEQKIDIKLHFKNNRKKHQNIQNRRAYSNVIKKKTILSTIFASLLLFNITFSSNIKAQVVSVDSEDNNGIVSVTSLMSAVSNNDLQGVEFFAKFGAGTVNQKNIGGATALNIASRNGNIEIINTLIKNGANVNLSDNEGWTPLMRASISKNPELVRTLLDSGADVKKINSMGETVIIHASSSDCFECLEQIFAGYEFSTNLERSVLNSQIQSAITIAEKKNNPQTQAILKSYKDSLEANQDQYTDSSLTENLDVSKVPIDDSVTRDRSILIVRALDGSSKVDAISKALVNKSDNSSTESKKSKYYSTYKFRGEKTNSRDNADLSQVKPIITHNLNTANVDNIKKIIISTPKPTTGQKFIFSGFKKSSPFVLQNSFPQQESIQSQEKADNSLNPKKFIFSGFKKSSPFVLENTKNSFHPIFPVKSYEKSSEEHTSNQDGSSSGSGRSISVSDTTYATKYKYKFNTK